jgi:hopanoid biosynthesis associated RND transporter like protein HpnN
MLTVALSLGLAAITIIYAGLTLTFETSMLQLLPNGTPYVARYQDYSKEFGELDPVVVVVEGRTTVESKAYAARLTGLLRQGPIGFHRLAYRTDPVQFQQSALLHLSLDEVRDVRDKILDRLDLMKGFAANPTLDRLIEGINHQIVKDFVGRFFDLGLGDERSGTDLGVLRALLAEISARADRPGPYRSPWSAFFSPGAEDADAGYFFSKDKRLLFVLADPISGARGAMSDQAAIEEIRRHIAHLHGEFPSVKVGVTGGPALASDEMTTALVDGQLATLLAVVLTLGVLLVAFRWPGQPLLMLGALGVSLAWSLGIIAVAIGHLTVFSVMFISIVVGLGIDYGIYFLFRHKEELGRGRTVGDALGRTAAGSGPGILLGALTGAATFYVLMLAKFRGIQEFGFVAGTALIMALTATLTLFPALLVLVARRRARRSPPGSQAESRAGRPDVPWLETLVRHPAPVLLTAGFVTVLSLWGARGVDFDYNLLDLQAKGTESVVWERHILATEGRSSFSALATATSLPELRRKHQAFERLDTVSDVDSALLLVPDQQTEKLEVIGEFAPQVAAIRIQRPQPFRLERLVDALASLGRRFDLAAAEAGPGGPPPEVQAVRAQIGGLLEKLRASERQRLETNLGGVQAELRADFARAIADLQEGAKARLVTLENLPSEIRNQFIGKSGLLLMQIHPKVDIWERGGAMRFVEELRSVDPEVTGTPVIKYEALQLMEQAYRYGTVYAILLLAFLTALMIRQLPETMLALVPPLLGTVWAIGLMRVFGIKFNMANVWGLPLIIGASAEYGVNVLLRSVEARAHGGPLLARSTVAAVLFNGLTTIVGFGSLLVAHHQGMWSLGLLLTIGSATSLVAALLVLPVLVHIFLQPAATPAAPVTERAP